MLSFKLLPVIVFVYAVFNLAAQPAEAQTRSANACPKVVGGCKADTRNWPAYAALRLASKNEEVADYICGGTAISERWILTAAHCVQDYRKSLEVPAKDAAGTAYTARLQVILGAGDP